jgi:hypothetical protein
MRAKDPASDIEVSGPQFYRFEKDAPSSNTKRREGSGKDSFE